MSDPCLLQTQGGYPRTVDNLSAVVVMRLNSPIFNDKFYVVQIYTMQSASLKWLSLFELGDSLSVNNSIRIYIRITHIAIVA